MAMGSVLGVVLGGMDVSNDGWYTQRTEGIVQDGAVYAYGHMYGCGYGYRFNPTGIAEPDYCTTNCTTFCTKTRQKSRFCWETHFETL